MALLPGLQDVAVCRDSGAVHVPIVSGLITLPNVPCTMYRIMIDHHGAHHRHQDSSGAVASNYQTSAAIASSLLLAEMLILQLSSERER